MTRTAPQPPPGIDARPAPDLPSAARTAADLIDDATAHGLPAPTTFAVHAYQGLPDASLHLYSRTPGIWHALNAWAARYGGEISTHPHSTDPARVHASTEFRRDGVRFEVSTIIDNAEDDDGDGS